MRGLGGNTGTCAVAYKVRALDRVASPRPILASPRERELRKRTRSTPHDTGAAHATAILGAIVVDYVSLSTPINSLDIMRFAILPSHDGDTTTPPHGQENQDYDPYDGPGVPPLGLGLGTWFWCFLVRRLVLVLSWSGTLGLGYGKIQRPWDGPDLLETPHLGPRKFCKQKFGVQFSILADR